MHLDLETRRLGDVDRHVRAAIVGCDVAEPFRLIPLLDRTPSLGVQVACSGDQVVGFVGYDRSRDPRTPPTMGEICAIHLLASHHGQGVGLALWDVARDGLLEEGCTHVSVWVVLAQGRALRFLELAGFKRDMASLRTVARGAARVEEIRLKRML